MRCSQHAGWIRKGLRRAAVYIAGGMPKAERAKAGAMLVACWLLPLRTCSTAINPQLWKWAGAQATPTRQEQWVALACGERALGLASSSRTGEDWQTRRVPFPSTAYMVPVPHVSSILTCGECRGTLDTVAACPLLPLPFAIASSWNNAF